MTSPSPFRVRRATRADLDAFTGQRLAIFGEAQGLGPGPVADDLERRTRTSFLALVDDPATFLWLAVDERGRPAGSAACHTFARLPSPTNMAGREACVSHVFVDPAWRRRGVGRALVAAIVDDARRAGLVRVRLHATADGRLLYESFGFRLRENDMELRL